jgi:Glycosyltransferase family 87
VLSPSDSSPDRRGPAVLVVALLLFIVLCVALPSVWRGSAAISDVPVYQRYGDAVERGAVPYRDFRLEYPPGALAVFALPSLATDGRVGYARAFAVEMAVLGLACVVFTYLALGALGVSLQRLAVGVAVPAAAPLLLGPLVLTRFDLFPAALVAGALAAFVVGRVRLGGAVLGAAVAAKLYPVVIVPVVIAWIWRTRGRREALTVLAISAGVTIAVFLPFAAVAPVGVAASLARQLARPLQIESVGAAVLLVLHQFGMPLGWDSSHGSQNLTGVAATVAAALTSVVQVGALLWTWRRYAPRGALTADAFVRACAASLLTFVVLGKVLSPQFLIWLLVVVALVCGRSARPALALLVVACGLTRGWFPGRYWSLVFSFDPLASWLVAARDLTLLALLVVLIRPVRERARSS